VPLAVHIEVAHGEVEPLECVVDVVDAVADEVAAVNRNKDQRDFVFAVAATTIWLKHVRRPILPQSLSLRSNARSATRPGPGMRIPPLRATTLVCQLSLSLYPQFALCIFIRQPSFIQATCLSPDVVDLRSCPSS
jgi:hypothetical protein